MLTRNECKQKQKISFQLGSFELKSPVQTG